MRDASHIENVPGERSCRQRQHQREALWQSKEPKLAGTMPHKGQVPGVEPKKSPGAGLHGKDFVFILRVLTNYAKFQRVMSGSGE